ncbi:MAG: hypothetical protein JKX69_00030 [Rhodobacteraceae bacterium]|nr:hypothetical protein [Paracoccaceae bacterium]PHR53951.1 MAG: hypothetical protein COA47_16295 [Robiginitomaculum sp.]
MGLNGIVERLDKYQKRVASGRAEKIKPHHIQKAIEKLTAKEVELVAELAGVTKPSKRLRFEEKISMIQKQVERAKWLAQQI